MIMIFLSNRYIFSHITFLGLVHDVTITRLQREHEDQSAAASQAIDQLRRQLTEADEQRTMSSQAMERMRQELAEADERRARDSQEIA
jgi:hypothetical protein